MAYFHTYIAVSHRITTSGVAGLPNRALERCNTNQVFRLTAVQTAVQNATNLAIDNFLFHVRSCKFNFDTKHRTS